MFIKKELIVHKPVIDVSIWQFVMLFLCIYVLAVLFVQTVGTLPQDVDDLLNQVDNGVCIIFLADFFSNLLRAKNKLKYLKWGWIDFISSIPSIHILRWGRFARVFRILRILRGVRSSKVLIQFFLQNRAKSAFATVSLISFVLVVFGSISILNCETVPGSNIKSAGDALWWAFVTITTVGYGDFYPITPLGRLIAAVLMTAGVGLFGTFTAYIASFFIEPEIRKEREKEISSMEYGELLKELHEIKRRLEQIEANNTSNPTD